MKTPGARCQINIRFLCSLVFIAFLLAVPQAGASESGKSPLWALKTDQGTVYLMGSMHLLKKEAYPLKKTMEEAYRDCGLLVLETDPDAAETPEFQARVLALGLYQDGTTLEQHVSKEIFALVRSKAVAAGLPVEQINLFKPWMCALFFVQHELARLGLDPKLGLDRHFFEQARKDGKKTDWLEPVDFQLQLLAELGKENEEAYLRQTFGELDLMKNKTDQMYTLWHDGDINGLAGFLDQEFKGFPELYNRLFLARNQKWLPKIEKWINQKSKTLIIVGYGHLVGPQGLIQMLKAKGYRIDQL